MPPKACIPPPIVFLNKNTDGDNADRFDKCGAFHLHKRLLHHVDLRGEWQVCEACLDSWSQGNCTVSGDFRMVPRHWWMKMYDVFQIGCDSAGTTEGVLSDADGAAGIINENDMFQPLNVTLDYILHFLEGHHAKSSTIKQTTHTRVMKLVKAAMAWKKTSRTSTEVEEYTRQLDSVMGDIVKEV